MTFEEITRRMIQDLGPLDEPKSREFLCDLWTNFQHVIQFTVQIPDSKEFSAWISMVMQQMEILEVTDVMGCRHVISTSHIVHVKIMEEKDE